MIYWTVEHGVRRGRSSSDTRWDGQRLTPYEWLERFRDRVAPQVVVGVYRASRIAPPQIFYAHKDHADVAAHIAIADSVLQEHRGFPLLIDLADNVCRGVFGRDTLEGPVAAAYADAGAPFRYLSERQTRYR